MKKIDWRTLTPDENGCLIWPGRISHDGYGMPGGIMAHRRAYEEAYGPIPAGFHIDHLCRVRACINPEHLEAVTPIENWNRGVSVSRLASLREECKNGHEYTAENTRVSIGVRGKPVRICRACVREAARRYRDRRAGAVA